MREANVKSKGESFLLYFLFCPMYNVVRAEDAEEIFQSTKLITKNVVYNLIKPFLGEGLLVSTGECNCELQREQRQPLMNLMLQIKNGTLDVNY